LARYERRLQSTMNQLLGRLLQLQKVRQHGILDEHAGKLMMFQDPENINERAKAKIEPNDEGSDPRQEIYGRWEDDRGDQSELVPSEQTESNGLERPSPDVVEPQVAPAGAA
jgi:hypothetical protein